MEYSLGKKLTELRKKRGWTQEEVARKLKISAQAVSKWENDISLPDLEMIKALARLYETSIDDLLNHQSQALVDVGPQSGKKIDRLVFRIKVLTHDGDKVNVNLPMPLVKIALEMGVTPKVDGKDVLKDIDLQQVMALVEKGVIGKIVEVETKDGDFVEIVVE